MQINYEEFICEAARAAELPVQSATLPDIVAALQMLELMAHQVMAFPLDSNIEPAPVFIA